MEERPVACNCAQAGEMGGWNGSVFLLLGGSMIRIVHLRPWNFGNDFYGNFLISTVLAAPWIRRACCWPTSFALSKYVSPSRKKKVRIPVTGGPWRSQRMVASVRSGVPVARSKRHVCATGFLFYFWWSAGRRVIMSTVVAGEGRASKESLSVCSLFGVPCQVTKRGAARRSCQGLPQQHSARQAKTSVLISPPCDGSVGRASSGARVVVGQ
jgi:hypothetical protein